MKMLRGDKTKYEVGKKKKERKKNQYLTIVTLHYILFQEHSTD